MKCHTWVEGKGARGRTEAAHSNNDPPDPDSADQKYRWRWAQARCFSKWNEWNTESTWQWRKVHSPERWNSCASHVSGSEGVGPVRDSYLSLSLSAHPPGLRAAPREQRQSQFGQTPSNSEIRAVEQHPTSSTFHIHWFRFKSLNKHHTVHLWSHALSSSHDSAWLQSI